MSSHLPIIHSIIDAYALSEFISKAWDLPAPIHCELLTRGMNDVYLVRDGKGTRWACRVWRSGFRSQNDVHYETAFLGFLDSKGLPVAVALTARDGALFQPLMAIEGQRYCAIFRWASGEPYGDNPDSKRAHILGEAFGQMHKLVNEFYPPVSRFVDAPGKMRAELGALQKMNRHRPQDLEWYSQAVEVIAAALEKISPKVIPMGATHGDFHLFNAFFDEESFTLLDFDNCGSDYFISELNSFIWANHYVGGIDESINESFLDGYCSQRKMTEEELSLMPIFYAAKEMRFLCGFASNVNAVGHTTLLNPNLDWFAERTRKNIRDAGLV